MTSLNTKTANFNPIARPYRWLEYLTLGPILQQTRLHHLPSLTQQNSALVIGDGDGRFLAQLLTQNPHIQAEAIDTSATMLHLLRQRCAPHANRLQTHQADALAFQPTKRYDLVVTHFFLDCLTQTQLEALITQISPHLNTQSHLAHLRLPHPPNRPHEPPRQNLHPSVSTSPSASSPASAPTPSPTTPRRSPNPASPASPGTTASAAFSLPNSGSAHKASVHKANKNLQLPSTMPHAAHNLPRRRNPPRSSRHPRSEPRHQLPQRPTALRPRQCL